MDIDRWPCMICHKTDCVHTLGDELVWCEQTSAFDAANQLMDALGVKGGGLGQMTAEIIKQRNEARDALYRLRKWDMLDHTADGPYWKTLIDSVLR